VIGVPRQELSNTRRMTEIASLRDRISQTIGSVRNCKTQYRKLLCRGRSRPAKCHLSVCSTVLFITELMALSREEGGYLVFPLQSAEMSSQRQLWMELALAEAEAARNAGEVPVGAVIVKNGELIAAGQNRNLRDHDPSAHAEIVALRAAGAHFGNHRLEGCEIYVIIEPCAMCAGAMVHARLKCLIYGATDPKGGAVESALNVLNHPRLNHKMEVVGGVLEANCSALLRDFFRARRLGSE
jgi:tRNA(adenine34) deaminase